MKATCLMKVGLRPASLELPCCAVPYCAARSCMPAGALQLPRCCCWHSHWRELGRVGFNGKLPRPAPPPAAALATSVISPGCCPRHRHYPAWLLPRRLHRLLHPRADDKVSELSPSCTGSELHPNAGSRDRARPGNRPRPTSEYLAPTAQSWLQPGVLRLSSSGSGSSSWPPNPGNPCLVQVGPSVGVPQVSAAGKAGQAELACRWQWLIGEGRVSGLAGRDT